MNCDVAVIGGGPGGSTLGTFLRKYDPKLKVEIFEREVFPRDHVGESHLPLISYYLDEMGVWDRIEAAGFPIKIGATYKWGKTKELWDFDFILGGKLQDEPRPAKFEGQRRYTAFQVDRAHYDEILLDYAQELGCGVHEGVGVTKVNRSGDRVDSLELSNGETVTARYYIDASGHTGILRRALDVPVEYPTGLQNIAVWDYWQNARWAENIGIGGTRVQVISVGYGWIWFIPLGPTRTSIGLIMPVDYYKASKKRPEELYMQALSDEPRISELIREATREFKLATTKDWSFLARRLYGENWFLVGESAGFADPVLAAGLTITHGSAREAAFTILELDRGWHEAAWLKEEYQKLQENRVRNHQRFAAYWYSANEQFSDLKEFTSKIADMNGLDLSPEKAWQWLAQGGFIDDDHVAGTATLSLSALKGLGTYLTPMEIRSPLGENNVFKLNLEGAKKVRRAKYELGGVRRFVAYQRGAMTLPLEGVFEMLFNVLKEHSTLEEIVAELNRIAISRKGDKEFETWYINRVPVAFEAMIVGGWIDASLDPEKPVMPVTSNTGVMHWHVDTNEALRKIAES
ncbi:MAG: NAD(P)/FAD-dependent oxidoreductase [Fimbriimonas sp.]|nr:NAD(P)/FAD-dependent oxidoreductase [Fimbriimonas sp.]